MAKMTKAERKAMNDQLDEAWKKERKRIMERGRALEKRGYTLDADFVPPKEMSKHDKRILNRIKKFKGDEVYKKVSFSAKGKTVHGKRSRQYEKEVKAQNEEVPTVDIFEELKTKTRKLINDLHSDIQGYDWEGKAEVFKRRRINVDVLAYVEELHESLEIKFDSLNDSPTTSAYHDYLIDNTEKINLSIDNVYAASTGEWFLFAVDEALNLIMQNNIRMFDSGEFNDYGLDNGSEE